MSIMNTARFVLTRFIYSLALALICAYDDGLTYLKMAENITFEKLTIWIASTEIEHLVGFPLDIFVVLDGKVTAALQDAIYDAQLPVLPPEINSVRISWVGPDDTYQYKFPDFRSLDPHVMHNPLLNIAKYGYVPHKRETFTISIPCTGKKTGIASMYLSLDIVRGDGSNIPGSPLKLHIRKRCIAYADSKTSCEGKCQNGGICHMGTCACKQGYHGSYCQLAACFPTCKNNGTCIQTNKCVCPRGYSGSTCERVRCKSNCSGRGVCLEPNKCTCPPEYHGEHCQYETGICDPACQNGGTCSIDQVCHCRDGYGGSLCQTPTCKKSCGDHGWCHKPNSCRCQPGWRGRFCHKVIHRPEKSKEYGKRKLRHARRGSKRNSRRKKQNKRTESSRFV